MNVRRNDDYQRAAAEAARVVEDRMRRVFDLCQVLRQTMQPFGDLQEQIVRIQAQIQKTHEQNLAVVRAIQDQARFASAVGMLYFGSLRSWRNNW